MSQYYSDPTRENDPHALPDLEVFYWSADDIAGFGKDAVDADGDDLEPGWYWWSCFPGCMPNGDACGPFETEAEALADARDGMEP